MKFFHLSDLHIGKRLHNYSLIEDQQAVLDQIIGYARQLKPDAVLIAGDVYDKPQPSAEAVECFDHFLSGLTQTVPAVMIISGNHDSAERLDFASSILAQQQVYISGKAPQAEDEMLKRVEMTDEYGTVDFYLMPFIRPSFVRHLFPENPPAGYNEAAAALLGRERIDYAGSRNVLLSHQFYVSGTNTPQTSESETISVGGIDQVDTAAISGFDYVALGHLHRAQQIGGPQIRYCGTPLKYSVSEAPDEKQLYVVELGAKGAAVKTEVYPLTAPHDVRRMSGTLEQLLNGADAAAREDYVSLTLTDEGELYHPREQLEQVYRRILEIRIDNSRTRSKLAGMDEAVVLPDPLTDFRAFFTEMQGRGMSGDEEKELQKIFEQAGEAEE